MPSFTRLQIPGPILDLMLTHARAELPNECCGLLAGMVDGETGRVTRQFPVRNDLASSTEYATNPKDMLDALKAIRSDGTEILAIYHSHPAGAPVPSCKDVERNYWGESAVHVIIGLGNVEPDVRAWWLGESGYRAAELV